MENKNRIRKFRIEIASLWSRVNREQQVRVAFERCENSEFKVERHSIDQWVAEIAPSPELMGWFEGEEGKWHEFDRRYRRELAKFPIECEHLRSLACRTTLTLIYVHGRATRNAAVVLKRHLIELECQRRWDSGLMIGGHTSPVRKEIERCGGLWFGWHKAWMMPDRKSCDYIRSLLPGDF